MKKIFLQASWNMLAMFNFSIDKDLLHKYLPNKTELDLWNNTCYVSLIGFMFQNTKVKGIKIPFHINFEEVNLRFYVRFKDGNQWKRGTVFIKEIVPKKAITLMANLLYKEHYETCPMNHNWDEDSDKFTIEYSWKKRNWNSIKVVSEKTLNKINSGSEEEFITEHYWGYTKLNESKTIEYGVEHPRWEYYKVNEYLINVDFKINYGSSFEFLNNQKPKSVFLAKGSDIIVRESRKL